MSNKIGYKSDIANWLMEKAVGPLGNTPRTSIREKMYRQWVQWRMFEPLFNSERFRHD